jgi:hypothetical protein
MAEQRTVNPLVESSSLSPGAEKTPVVAGVFLFSGMLPIDGYPINATKVQPSD